MKCRDMNATRFAGVKERADNAAHWSQKYAQLMLNHLHFKNQGQKLVQPPIPKAEFPRAFFRKMAGLAKCDR